MIGIVKIRESLCFNDIRNPKYTPTPFENRICVCDNCKFGLNDLAVELFDRYYKFNELVEELPIVDSIFENKFIVMDLSTKLYMYKDNSFGKFLYKAKKFNSQIELISYISNGELKDKIKNTKISIVVYLKIIKNG